MAQPPVLPEDLWRDFVVPGNRNSGAYQPPKADARALDRWFVDQIEGLAGATGIDPSIITNLRTDLNQEVLTRSSAITNILNRLSDANFSNVRDGGLSSALALGTVSATAPMPIGGVAGTPSNTAAAGSILVLGTPFPRDGALSSVPLWIRTLGNGAGNLVLVSNRRTYSKIERVIPITVTATGLITLVCGQHIPQITVKAGWYLGYSAPSGGALLGFNPTGGASRTVVATPKEGDYHTLTSQVFALALAAFYVSPVDITTGRTLVAGAAAPVGTLWVESERPLVAGPIKQLQAYIQTLGTGNLVFALVSQGPSGYAVEALIPVKATAAGAVTFNAGADFPAISALDGWMLGLYALSGGAQVAYGGGGAAGFVALSRIGTGSVGQLETSAAAFSIQAVQAAATPIGQRLSATEQATRDLQNAVALLTPTSYTRDVVLSCTATVAAQTVTISGTLLRAGRQIPFAGTLTLDAATTGPVTNEALTIAQGTATRYGTNPAGNRLANANVSNVVVRDAGTNAVLVLGTDYAVGAEHGIITNLAASGTRNVLVSYTYSKRRYDTIALNPEALTVHLAKGPERVRDAAETVVRLTNSIFLRLFNVRVAGDAIDLVPTWDIDPATGLRFGLASQFARDQRQARRALTRTRALMQRGAPVTVAVLGDSIAAIQSAAPSTSAPNGAARDRASASGTANTYLREAISPDLVDALPLYDTGDGAGQVHTRMSFMWSAIAQIQRMTTLSYLNFGVGGWATSQGKTDPILSAVANSAADLVVIHYGMNELGLEDTEANMRAILDRFFTAGKEVVVVGTPRTNAVSAYTEVSWTQTCRALGRAAEYVHAPTGLSAAYLDPLLYYGAGNNGALGISPKDFCQANLHNHPGIAEHAFVGWMLATLILG